MAESSSSPSVDLPLAGLLVVDLSRYLPGPLVGRLLADLGARVIKVEEPTMGDPSRQAPPLNGGQSSLSTLLLAGHESLALDLKKPVAREALEELLVEADVLVESFRPGVLAAWGLAPEDLRQRFPRLVICSVSGWGQMGHDAKRAGHDLTYQAVAGSLAAGQGMPHTQTADIVGAWSGVTSVLAALYRRQADDQGCWIDQALLDAAGHASITALAMEAEGAKEVGQQLPLTGALACYNLYATKDGGQLALAALEPRFWQRFCAAVERRDLTKRQFSADPKVRQEVAALIVKRSREEWITFFAELDIPVDPVLSLAEARQHPQVVSRGLFQKGADGALRIGFPARFDGVRPEVGGDFPQLGEHTRELVEEFDLTSGHSRYRRHKGGVGRRFSLRAWAQKVVASVASRRST